MSGRYFRRLCERYEEDGSEGLRDRRIGKVSPRRRVVLCSQPYLAAHRHLGSSEGAICLPARWISNLCSTRRNVPRLINLAAFAHVWTVRGDKLARFDMHTDTAKVLEGKNTQLALEIDAKNKLNTQLKDEKVKLQASFTATRDNFDLADRSLVSIFGLINPRWQDAIWIAGAAILVPSRTFFISMLRPPPLAKKIAIAIHTQVMPRIRRLRGQLTAEVPLCAMGAA